MHACMHACMYVCMHACMYVCMYVWMYVCMYVYTYIYICLYLFIHLHIHIYIYIYIYTHSCFSFCEFLPMRRSFTCTASCKRLHLSVPGCFLGQTCSLEHLIRASLRRRPDLFHLEPISNDMKAVENQNALAIMGVSINGGTPKSMVYNGKSHWNG